MVTFLLLNNETTSDLAATWERDVFLKSVKDYNAKPGQYEFSFMVERSVPDELGVEAGQQVLVVVLSYTVMLVYVALAIGSFPNLVHSGYVLPVSA